jgi:hypothetical protein
MFCSVKNVRLHLERVERTEIRPRVAEDDTRFGYACESNLELNSPSLSYIIAQN